MSDPDLQQKLTAPLRMLQMIVVAMVVGLVIFLVVAVLLSRNGGMMKPGEGETPIVTYVAVFFAITAVGVASFLPKVIVGNRLRAIAGMEPGEDAEQLIAVFNSTFIIRAAVTEAPGLFLLVSYMVEGQQIALLLAIASIVLLAFMFPRRDAVAAWLDQQLRTIEDLRVQMR